jgi:hypothetical protein
MMLSRLATCLLALLLTACSTVNSNYAGADPRSKVQRGVPYYLPKAMVRVSVTLRTDDSFLLKVEAPVMVPDADYLFHADLRHGPLSDDVSEIKVDPSTSLLTNVDVTSTGRAAELLENAAKLFGMLQAGEQDAGERIFFGLYDPADLSTASADANAAIRAYYTRQCGKYGDLSDAAFASVQKQYRIAEAADVADMKVTLARCRVFQMHGVDKKDLVKIELLDGAALAAAPFAMLGNDRPCTRGVCYRPMVPIRIGTTVADTYKNSDIFMVPDRSRLSHIELTAGAFANQKYVLGFDKGALVSAKFDTKSELVGFSTLPIKLITAVISGPAQMLGLKSNAMKAEDDYLKAMETHAKQVKQSSEFCASSTVGCPDTARKIIGTSTSATKPPAMKKDQGGGARAEEQPGEDTEDDGGDGPVFGDDPQ